DGTARSAPHMSRQGQAWSWLDCPDAVYRTAPYASPAALFGEVTAEEWATLPAAVEAAILAELAAREVDTNAPIYAPLGAGNHVDHQIVCEVGVRLWRAGRPVWFYEDYPYAARSGLVAARVAALDAQLAPARLVPDTRDITHY